LTVEAGIGSTPPTRGRTTHETPGIPVDESRNDRIQDFSRVRLKRGNCLLSLGDLISAKLFTPSIRALQLLGQMSDATLQQLSRDRDVTGPKDVGKVTNKSGTVAEFEDHYGTG
jgi:hypothetical protein